MSLKRAREPTPWSATISTQDVSLLYVWKRPRNSKLELPVDSLHVMREDETSRLTLESRIELFSFVEQFACWQLEAQLPKLFETLAIYLRWLCHSESVQTPSNVEPCMSFEQKSVRNGKGTRSAEQLVKCCVEVCVFLTEWAQHIAPVLAPDERIAVASLLFEKALWCCSETLCKPLSASLSEEIEAKTSRVFVRMILRSSLMCIHLKLLDMKCPLTIFDKSTRESFARDSMLEALEMTADRRWFFSPVLRSMEESVKARASQPALGWLQGFIKWVQMLDPEKTSDETVWNYFAQAFLDARNVIQAEAAWDFVESVLAPVHFRVMQTENPKKCEFCKLNATTCGGWALVSVLVDKGKPLDDSSKIIRMETMLKLWCPDRAASLVINSLFGVHLNGDVSVNAFLGNGVFQITQKLPLSIALAEGTFSRSLILLRNYALSLEQVPEKRRSFVFTRVRSPFFNFEGLVKNPTNEADLKLLIQYYSVLLSLGTKHGLTRVYDNIVGAALVDEELAVCESNLRAVTVKAFHLLAVLCQDYEVEEELKLVIQKFRAWVKFEGLIVYLWDVVESLVLQNSFCHPFLFPLLGEMLKEHKVLERPGEKRQIALNVISHLLSPDLCNAENLVFFREWEAKIKNEFQASLKNNAVDVLDLARTSVRLTYFCSSKTGVDIQDFTLKNLSTITSAQRKTLYLYWMYVLASSKHNNQLEEKRHGDGEEGSFLLLLSYASSSSFATSLSLPRLLIDLFKDDNNLSRFECLYDFLNCLASLLHTAKTVSRSSVKFGIQQMKVDLVSDVLLLYFRELTKSNSEEWIKRLVFSLGSSSEAMQKMRELAMTKVICPLLVEVLCYKHLAAALLGFIAQLYSEGGNTQELSTLLATLEHFLTFSQAKAWERTGWIHLRALVYDVLVRIQNYKWPEAFGSVLQASVLRESDEVAGGKLHPKPTYSANVERSPVMRKFYDTELKSTEAPVEAVTTRQCLRKGIDALSSVLESVPQSLITQLEKVLTS